PGTGVAGGTVGRWLAVAAQVEDIGVVRVHGHREVTLRLTSRGQADKPGGLFRLGQGDLRPAGGLVDAAVQGDQLLLLTLAAGHIADKGRVEDGVRLVRARDGQPDPGRCADDRGRDAVVGRLPGDELVVELVILAYVDALGRYGGVEKRLRDGVGDHIAGGLV